MCAVVRGKRQEHILWRKRLKKGRYWDALGGAKKLSKKAKKVLTKRLADGNISERLNEGRLSGVGKS